MNKRKVVFFGNHLAMALQQFCQRFLAPRIGDLPEAIDIAAYEPATAREVLANADVIVHQMFDRPAELNIPSEYADREIVAFPNVWALFYWPYANQRHPRSEEVAAGRDVGPYPTAMGDRFLNRLILAETPADEALRLYLEEDMSASADRLFEINRYLQRQRDAASGFDIQRHIERHFREEQLFLTPAHPQMRLFGLLAEGVFRRLGYAVENVRDALAAQRVAPFARLALPIHPKVISHFGLRFADAGTRYPFFDEGDFTFAEYVRRYVDFEWNPALQDALRQAETDPDTALPLLEKALSASPRSAVGARVKSRLLLRAQAPAAAIAAATLAIELDPAEPGNWLALSRAQRRAGHIERAKAAIARAAEVAPRDAEVRSEAAELAADQAAWDRAIDEMRQAIDIEPGAARLHSRLADLLMAAGRLAEAVAAARQAVELSAHADIFEKALADLLARAEQIQAGAESPRPAGRTMIEVSPQIQDTAIVATRSDRMDEIRGFSRRIGIGEGLHLLRVAASEAGTSMIAGIAVPGTMVIAHPDDAEAVTIMSAETAAKGWIGAAGGALVVRAGRGGGSILATTYGCTDAAALPEVTVLPLNRLADAEALRALAPAAEPSPRTAVAAPALAGREIAGELLLHIERQGDCRFLAGAWAGNPNGRLRVEGFAIRPLEAIAPGDIEYMAFGPGGRQTPWVSDVKLCGTRGRGFPITGFAVRLGPLLRERFDVEYEGYFFDSGVRGPLRNGEPCLPSVVDDPLGAIRLRVIERPGA